MMEPRFGRVKGALELTILVVASTYGMFANSVSPEDQFKKALEHYVAGNYSSSLKLLNSALRLSPDDPSMLHARGNVYYELHDYEKAIQH